VRGELCTKKKVGEGATNQQCMHSYRLIMRHIDTLFICVRSENIVAIGTDDDIAREFKGVKVDKTIDASGCCILPGKIEFNTKYNSNLFSKGFIDAHTHPIWAGDRVHEYAKKV
jgi:imidazolonepropionase